jgi:hypothetical protein
VKSIAASLAPRPNGEANKLFFEDIDALGHNRGGRVDLNKTCGFERLYASVTIYVRGIGQVESDEIYVGLDNRGVHYVFPVQAKGGSDKLNMVRLEQDFALCAAKFPDVVCNAIAAQFMKDDLIALFLFEMGDSGITLLTEKHYRLVPAAEITKELLTYRSRLPKPVL